jgi:hypothetical protein
MVVFVTQQYEPSWCRESSRVEVRNNVHRVEVTAGHIRGLLATTKSVNRCSGGAQLHLDLYDATWLVALDAVSAVSPLHPQRPRGWQTRDHMSNTMQAVDRVRSVGGIPTRLGRKGGSGEFRPQAK